MPLLVIPVIQLISFSTLLLPQPMVQRVAVYEVLYFSPVKLWLNVGVLTKSEEDSLTSKARYPPGGGLQERMSMGRVRLGPIQVTFGTGAATIYKTNHLNKSGIISVNT